MLIYKIKDIIRQVVCSILVRTGIYGLLVLTRKSVLTVLMFHRIYKYNNHLGLSISPDMFEALLEYLSRKYNVISISEAVESLKSGTLRRDAVVITFDDGWRDNYTHAFPLLKKYMLPAAIFVTVDAIESGVFGWNSFDQAILDSHLIELDLSSFGLGKFPINNREQKISSISQLHQKLKLLDNSVKLAVINHVSSYYRGASGERVMLSWQEIKDMLASGLITIGSHTLTHPIMTRIPLSQAKFEIKESKRFIEEKTGAPVDFFAFPNGSNDDFNSEIIGLIAESGYKAAFSTIPGINRDLSERYSLRRIDVTYRMCQGVGGEFSKSMFAVKVSGAFQGILFKS